MDRLRTTRLPEAEQRQAVPGARQYTGDQSGSRVEVPRELVKGFAGIEVRSLSPDMVPGADLLPSVPGAFAATRRFEVTVPTTGASLTWVTETPKRWNNLREYRPANAEVAELHAARTLYESAISTLTAGLRLDEPLAVESLAAKLSGRPEQGQQRWLTDAAVATLNLLRQPAESEWNRPRYAAVFDALLSAAHRTSCGKALGESIRGRVPLGRFGWPEDPEINSWAEGISVLAARAHPSLP